MEAWEPIKGRALEDASFGIRGGEDRTTVADMADLARRELHGARKVQP